MQAYSPSQPSPRRLFRRLLLAVMECLWFPAHVLFLLWVRCTPGYELSYSNSRANTTPRDPADARQRSQVQTPSIGVRTTQNLNWAKPLFTWTKKKRYCQRCYTPLLSFQIRCHPCGHYIPNARAYIWGMWFLIMIGVVSMVPPALSLYYIVNGTSIAHVETHRRGPSRNSLRPRTMPISQHTLLRTR